MTVSVRSPNWFSVNTLKSGVSSCGAAYIVRCSSSSRIGSPFFDVGVQKFERLIYGHGRFRDELVAERDALRRLRGLLADGVAPEVGLPLEIHRGLRGDGRDGHDDAQHSDRDDAMCLSLHGSSLTGRVPVSKAKLV